MSNSVDRYGLVLQGFSDRKSIYFVLIAGFSSDENDDARKSFLSAAGAPESSYFSSVDVLSNPKAINQTIFDVRRTMIRENKHFYVEEVEEQFDTFFKRHLSRVVSFLETDDLSGLENYIEREFYRFEIDNVNASSVPFETLRQDPESDAEETTDEETESSTSDQSESDTTTIGIAPEIDVQNGRKVEDLQPGTPVIVRLTEKASELFGSKNPEERIRVSGDFLGFDCEENEAEGQIRVRIQDGLEGVGEVSRGSLIRLDQSAKEYKADPYERQLQPLLWMVVSLLVLLVFFVYLVIF